MNAQRTRLAPHRKYKGIAIADFNSYMDCRANIAAGFYVNHFTKLKAHYRRMFLNNPFRKGVVR